MIILPFENTTVVPDPANPLSTHYILKTGEDFYIEPAFLGQVLAIEERAPDKLSLILKEMIRIVKKNRKVIFTLDFHRPLTKKDDYILQEIHDVTNSLNLHFVNSSNLEKGAV